MNCHRPTHKYDYELALLIDPQKAVGKTLLRMRSHNSEKAYCHVHDIGFQYTMPHTALCVYATIVPAQYNISVD